MVGECGIAKPVAKTSFRSMSITTPVCMMSRRQPRGTLSVLKAVAYLGRPASIARPLR